MPKKPEIFLEEAVFDDLSRHQCSSLELPLSKGVFQAVLLFAGLVVALAVFRVFGLGVAKGSFYKDRAIDNISEGEILPAERGIIFDRFGRPLVKNIPSFRLVLRVSELFKLAGEEQDSQIREISKIANVPFEEIKSILGEIDLEKENSFVVADNLSVEQVALVKSLNWPAFKVENSFKRQYEYPEQFAHLLGYVGMASRENLKENPSLLFNDLVGKAGLESYYDGVLRGKNGKNISYSNAKNEVIEERFAVDPQSGRNLTLSVDAEFQKYFYQRLEAALRELGRSSGAGLAINPQNGEVLALVSLPSFNSNKLTKEMFSDPEKPLFNRVVSGVYNPGSTIKPLVAFASLSEKLVSPLKEIFSAGFIEIPNPYFPDKPSRFVDWKPHGWVNMYSALARSSNVYFYEVGGGFQDVKGLGIAKLNEYWGKFGLGEKTNIDLPAEKSGFLPDPEEKEKRTGVIWRLGDTYNVSIGQGDLAVTPLELLNYISSIASGGKFYRPMVVQKISDGKGSASEDKKPEIIREISGGEEYFMEVRKGMLEATKKSYGTAHLLGDLPLAVAAKTGSAQILQNTKVNAFFVGYAPASVEAWADKPAGNPQIAILVLVEDAREGSSNTVPVAKDVLKWYYENRIKGNNE